MDEIELTDPPIRVTLRRNRRARRFTLRMDVTGLGATLTVPDGVPVAETRSFLHRHTDWLRRAMERQPEAVSVADGAVLPVAGVPCRIALRPGPRRAPHLDDGRLIVQGPGAPGPRLAAWLKARARDTLAPAAHAATLDRRIARIALRDTRSRWGSCSTSGTVSFSWRLAMAPPEVLDYVAAHEAAHLVEMNHGPAFWALVSQLCPAHQRQRAWLRREGRDLHRYRFD